MHVLSKSGNCHTRDKRNVFWSHEVNQQTSLEHPTLLEESQTSKSFSSAPFAIDNQESESGTRFRNKNDRDRFAPR